MSPSVQTYGKITVLFVILGIVLNAFIGVGMSVSMVVDEPATVEMAGGSGTIATGGANLLAINSTTSSLEDAVRLDGQDNSEVSGKIDADVRGNWSLCTWAAAEDSVVNNSESRAIVGYNDIVVSYNGTSQEYETWYYDESTRDSYVSTVAAPDPTNQTLVCADHSDGELTTYQNGTAGTSTATTGDNIAPSPPASNWNGTLEETRLYNYSLSSSQQTSLQSEPIAAVDGAAPSARLMYDVRDRGDSGVPVHFAGGSAALSGGAFVDGFNGTAVSVGTDYTTSGWLNNTVSPTDTGVVKDDGTVLFVRFTGEGGTLWTTLANSLSGGMQLLAAGLVVLAAGFLLREFNEF